MGLSCFKFTRLDSAVFGVIYWHVLTKVTRDPVSVFHASRCRVKGRVRARVKVGVSNIRFRVL